MAEESKQTTPSSSDAQDDSLAGERENAEQKNTDSLESTAPNETADTENPTIDGVGGDAAGEVSPELADKMPVPAADSPEADSQATSETQSTRRITSDDQEDRQPGASEVSATPAARKIIKR